MKRERISKDQYYLNIAKAVSKRSTCLKRHYGAVIVNNDEIVATGYNGSAREEENCCDIHEHCPRYNAPHNQGNYTDCPAVHAEQNALLSASRSEIVNATLYLSGSTCCSSQMASVGITDIQVQYSSDNTKWYDYTTSSDLKKSNSRQYTASSIKIGTVKSGYYYRVTCKHYAKESGLFGSSENISDTSNSVWV